MHNPSEGEMDFDGCNGDPQPEASSDERRPTSSLGRTERSPPLLVEKPEAASSSAPVHLTSSQPAASNAPGPASSPVSHSLNNVRGPCEARSHYSDKSQAMSDADNIVDVPSERSRAATTMPKNVIAETSNRFVLRRNNLGDRRQGINVTMHRLPARSQATDALDTSDIANGGDGRENSDASTHNQPNTSSTSGTAYEVGEGSTRSTLDEGRRADGDNRLSLYSENRCLCLHCAPSRNRRWHTSSYQRAPWSGMHELNFWGFLALVYVCFVWLLILGLRAVMSKCFHPVREMLDAPSEPTSSSPDDDADHEDPSPGKASSRGTTGAF